MGVPLPVGYREGTLILVDNASQYCGSSSVVRRDRAACAKLDSKAIPPDAIRLENLLKSDLVKVLHIPPVGLRRAEKEKETRLYGYRGPGRHVRINLTHDGGVTTSVTVCTVQRVSFSACPSLRLPLRTNLVVITPLSEPTMPDHVGHGSSNPG
jgi:hypothetical protein